MHSKHTLFHYLFTIIITIIKDGLLIALAIVLVLGGIYFYQKVESFYRIALAIPLVALGVALQFMRLADVVEVILNPKINKARCMICSEPIDSVK